jgi:hypothetical protein
MCPSLTPRAAAPGVDRSVCAVERGLCHLSHSALSRAPSHTKNLLRCNLTTECAQSTQRQVWVYVCASVLSLALGSADCHFPALFPVSDLARLEIMVAGRGRQTLGRC